MQNNLLNPLLDTRRKNLVIVRAGNNSLHPEWLKGDLPRSWDIIINYYGDDPEIYLADDVTRMDSKGPKWPALFDLIMENPGFIEDYDYIWLPDDDLQTTKTEINRLFEICAKYQLAAAQPALTWNSYFGHITTLQNKKLEIRFTNYVEVMAPCFSSSLLGKALPFFNSNLSGWGLDFLWPKLTQNPESEIAIIDAVTVFHTRPVGGPNYNMLREKGVSPWDELRAFCKANGIDEEPIITTHTARPRTGPIINTIKQPRRFMFSSILAYLPALLQTPDRQKMLRRMAGMGWKAITNTPDRISERPAVKR